MVVIRFFKSSIYTLLGLLLCSPISTTQVTALSLRWMVYPSEQGLNCEKPSRDQRRQNSTPCTGEPSEKKRALLRPVEKEYYDEFIKPIPNWKPCLWDNLNRSLAVVDVCNSLSLDKDLDLALDESSEESKRLESALDDSSQAWQNLDSALAKSSRNLKELKLALGASFETSESFESLSQKTLALATSSRKLQDSKLKFDKSLERLSEKHLDLAWANPKKLVMVGDVMVRPIRLTCVNALVLKTIEDTEKKFLRFHKLLRELEIPRNKRAHSKNLEALNRQACQVQGLKVKKNHIERLIQDYYRSKWEKSLIAGGIVLTACLALLGT